MNFFANNIGFANPMFDTRYDQSPYIDTTRALIRFLDATDQINILIVVFSGIASLFTGWQIKKVDGLPYFSFNQKMSLIYSTVAVMDITTDSITIPMMVNHGI